MDNVHVIVNPSAARGKTFQRWDNIKALIGHYYTDFEFTVTEKPQQATDIAREQLIKGTSLIIAVGGDGTLNEIVNGFFMENSPDLINKEASLGVMPSGTGSDFIRFLKVPNDMQKALEVIKNSGNRKIDVGKLTFIGQRAASPGSNTSTPGKSKYFINIADFGLGAEVIKNLSSVPAAKRGAFFYYKGLLSTIKSYRSKTVKLIIDESEEIVDRFLIGAIANGRIFGGGMIIAPEAEPDDGFFDLVLIENMGRLDIIRNSRFLYNGRLHEHPKAIVKRIKKLKVIPMPAPAKPGEIPNVSIEYDGELGDSLPAEFELLEKKINLRL